MIQLRSAKKIPVSDIDEQFDNDYDETGEYAAQEKAKKKRFPYFMRLFGRRFPRLKRLDYVMG